MAKKPTDDRVDLSALSGFLSPRENPFFVGHEHAQNTLVSSFKSNHFPHAWMVTGAEGIGKASLVFHFIRNVFAHNLELCGDNNGLVALDRLDPVFAQVSSLSHPDMLVLQRSRNPKSKAFYSVIRVDDIRALNKFFGFTSAGGGWRFVVVDVADDMNNNAANALLKILEEPPEKSVFFLISSAPNTLPTTILSRCRKLRLFPLGEDDLKRAVQGAFNTSLMHDLPDEEHMTYALQKAQGSVRKALQYAVGNGLALDKQLGTLLARLPDIDYTLVHGLADRVTAKGTEDDFHTVHTLISSWMARQIKTTVHGKINETHSRLFPKTALTSWAELWQDIHRKKAECLLLNLDKRTHIINLFFTIQEQARNSLGR